MAETIDPYLRVICTQPRIVSATSLAERVAEEWSGGQEGTVGKFVGYHVGSSKKTSRHCRIEYVTESVFLMKLLEAFSTYDHKRAEYFSSVGAIFVDGNWFS